MNKFAVCSWDFIEKVFINTFAQTNVADLSVDKKVFPGPPKELFINDVTQSEYSHYFDTLHEGLSKTANLVWQRCWPVS